MNEYIRLLEVVENKMEIRKDSFGSVIAAKIHNNEEFDLMVTFWAVAHSSCCRRERINGTFVGEDWYFIESSTDDYGMDGKSTTYFTQTLTEKKQKFLEFCRKFDTDEQPTVDAVPVRHGHWIDKFGGEYRCSSCRKIVCIDDEVEFPNGMSYDYCPYCGSKMDAPTHSNDSNTLDVLERG